MSACRQIGIVGRTGAGKSSLLQALFRVVNLSAGAIEIDGRNIAEMGLQPLRDRLALVSQDSHLFRGTVRENLWVISFHWSWWEGVLIRGGGSTGIL